MTWSEEKAEERQLGMKEKKKDCRQETVSQVLQYYCGDVG